MERKLFLEMMDRDFAEIRELNVKKGADYAGDEDALRNFKDNAKTLGLTPEQVWAVYAGKHWDAIMTYCREGDVASEPIEGRLHDLILYGILLLGLVREKEGFKGEGERELPERNDQ